jgi:hypothetical protein
MHDPWTERLSEYLDGELAPRDAASLEEHLASCDVCAATLAGLERVVATAAALPVREPADDLWAGIAAAITTDAGSSEHAGSAERPAARGSDILSMVGHRRSAPRSITFTMPQLAAAALVVMTVSAATVWLAVSGPVGGSGSAAVEGTIFRSVTAPLPPQVRLVDTRPAAEEEMASLAALLEDARSSLDPATVEVVERSIESIRDAILAAQAALEADPGNPRLQRQLDSTLQRREDLVQRMSRVQRGGA